MNHSRTPTYSLQLVPSLVICAGLVAVALAITQMTKTIRQTSFSSSYSSSPGVSTIPLGNDRFAITGSYGINVYQVDKTGIVRHLDRVSTYGEELVRSSPKKAITVEEQRERYRAKQKEERRKGRQSAYPTERVGN